VKDKDWLPDWYKCTHTSDNLDQPANCCKESRYYAVRQVSVYRVVGDNPGQPVNSLPVWSAVHNQSTTVTSLVVLIGVGDTSKNVATDKITGIASVCAPLRNQSQPVKSRQRKFLKSK